MTTTVINSALPALAPPEISAVLRWHAECTSSSRICMTAGANHGGHEMRSAAANRIALVEAAYNLELGADEWLPNLLEAGAGLMDLGQGCAGAIWTGTSHQGAPLVSQLHAANGAPDLASRFARAAKEMSDGMAGAASAARKPGVHTLADAGRAHPAAKGAMSKHLGCKDMLALWATNPDFHGVGIYMPSKEPIELSRPARKHWRMLLTHIAAGHRLRRRLRPIPKGIPLAQLPLGVESNGFYVAGGEAPRGSDPVLETVRRRAVQLDQARGRVRGASSREALELGESVVRGCWSVVDWFDTENRRFVLAVPNAPNVQDPRGLTDREYQVAVQFGAGETCKMIAYSLGVSRSRVSALLRRAMRKLGVRTRQQLVLEVRTLMTGGEHGH